MQKKSSSIHYLKVSLHGMNDRAEKMMVKYLEMYCKDIVQVVHESESHAEIVDIDLTPSKDLLKKRLAQQPSKPIIVLSVQEVSIDNVIYVKKPIEIPRVVKTLKAVNKNLLSRPKRSESESYSETTANKPVQPSKNKQQSETKETTKSVNFRPKSSEQQKGSRVHDKEAAPKSVDYSKATSKPKKTPKDNLSAKIKKTVTIPQKKRESETQETKKPVSPSVTSRPKSSKRQKASVKHKEDALKSDDYSSVTSKSEKIPKDNFSSKIKKPVKSPKTSKPKATETSSIPSQEDESLSIEPDNITKKAVSPKKEQKKFKKKNNRKTIRYAFHSIEAQLKKNLFISLPAEILDISSRGALIELKNPSKLSGKTKLTIHFDSHRTFVIPARIVRTEGKSIYSLQFTNYQHELADYLVNSGKPYLFS